MARIKANFDGSIEFVNSVSLDWKSVRVPSGNFGTAVKKFWGTHYGNLQPTQSKISEVINLVLAANRDYIKAHTGKDVNTTVRMKRVKTGLRIEGQNVINACSLMTLYMNACQFKTDENSAIKALVKF